MNHVMFHILDVKLPGVYTNTNTRVRAVRSFIQVSIQESVFCLSSPDQAPVSWEAWSICRPKCGSVTSDVMTVIIRTVSHYRQKVQCSNE